MPFESARTSAMPIMPIEPATAVRIVLVRFVTRLRSERVKAVAIDMDGFLPFFFSSSAFSFSIL